ncbi:MAG: hypothetical protein ACFFDN_05965 [Candidatus Hodarchaeota archaeon]
MPFDLENRVKTFWANSKHNIQMTFDSRQRQTPITDMDKARYFCLICGRIIGARNVNGRILNAV